MTCARGIFDIRLWVEGADEQEVYERLAELVRTARLFAPPGVIVKYSQLRNPDRTAAFEGTMRPAWVRRGVGVTDWLPELLDAKALQRELGVTRAAAEAIMRAVPVVSIPGLRKTYCRRVDVARLLEERTFAKDQVPA